MASIVVIDDDHNFRDMLGQMLKRCGHACQDFSNPTEALRHLGNHKADLVITDIMMPGMDGLALAQIMRDRFPFIPIIAMSGGPYMEKPSNQLYNAGAYGVHYLLPKPFGMEDLKQNLEKALASSLALE